ncbi:MAG: hypothetical protein KIT36_14360 [Alphaproteobacteria bacterium]|nr:hypothetical protein [Alphaproteobacteria bacterium]
MSDAKTDARAEAAVAADLLSYGALLHRLSLPLTVVGALAMPLLALAQPSRPAMALASLVVVAGLAELWFAARVAFDACAFQRLARGDEADGLTATDFDAAMGALGLVPVDKAGRPVADRVRGAMRLLARQAALAVAQVVLLVAGGWLLAVTRGA